MIAPMRGVPKSNAITAHIHFNGFLITEMSKEIWASLPNFLKIRQLLKLIITSHATWTSSKVSNASVINCWTYVDGFFDQFRWLISIFFSTHIHWLLRRQSLVSHALNRDEEVAIYERSHKNNDFHLKIATKWCAFWSNKQKPRLKFCMRASDHTTATIKLTWSFTFDLIRNG